MSLAALLALEQATQAKTYLYAGIFFLASFAILHYYLYLRVRDAGQKKDISNFLLIEIPIAYLRLREKYIWSPWPAILIWPLLVAGIALLALGVSRL